MSTIDRVGPAPETRGLSFPLLILGAGTAPIFWLGQLMLGYGVTAYACYPGDHPVTPTYASVLHGTLIGFDLVALIAVAAGGAISWWCWKHVGREAVNTVNPVIGASRVRFLALWGLFSSLWFFFAVLFNTIASLTVPPCLI